MKTSSYKKGSNGSFKKKKKFQIRKKKKKSFQVVKSDKVDTFSSRPGRVCMERWL